jgi:MFS family permease
VISTVALTPLPFLNSIAAVAILGFVVGIATAPALICGFTIVENLVPAARLTESITWTLAGIGIGVAVSASLCGAAIDTWGAWSAFAIGVGGAALAAVASALTLPRLSRAWHEQGLDAIDHPPIAT